MRIFSRPFRSSSSPPTPSFWAPPRPPDVLRIACLGDSDTYGTGLDVESTWPKQLEAKLRERHSGLAIEALNAGVYAYNTSQMVAWYRTVVAKFEPQIVILMGNVNEASGRNMTARENTTSSAADWNNRLGLTSGLWDEADMTEATPSVRRTMFLRRHSRLADFAAHRLHKILMGRHMGWSYNADWDQSGDGVRMVGEALDELVRLSESDGFRCLAAQYPHLVSLNENYPFRSVAETFERLCTERGLDFVDLLPAPAGQEAKQLHVHPHDRHPNRIAGDLVTGALADQLDSWVVELAGRPRKPNSGFGSKAAVRSSALRCATLAMQDPGTPGPSASGLHDHPPDRGLARFKWRA